MKQKEHNTPEQYETIGDDILAIDGIAFYINTSYNEVLQGITLRHIAGVLPAISETCQTLGIPQDTATAIKRDFIYFAEGIYTGLMATIEDIEIIITKTPDAKNGNKFWGEVGSPYLYHLFNEYADLYTLMQTGEQMSIEDIQDYNLLPMDGNIHSLTAVCEYQKMRDCYNVNVEVAAMVARQCILKVLWKMYIADKDDSILLGTSMLNTNIDQDTIQKNIADIGNTDVYSKVIVENASEVLVNMPADCLTWFSKTTHEHVKAIGIKDVISKLQNKGKKTPKPHEPKPKGQGSPNTKSKKRMIPTPKELIKGGVIKGTLQDCAAVSTIANVLPTTLQTQITEHAKKIDAEIAKYEQIANNKELTAIDRGNAVLKVEELQRQKISQGYVEELIIKVAPIITNNHIPTSESEDFYTYTLKPADLYKAWVGDVTALNKEGKRDRLAAAYFASGFTICYDDASRQDGKALFKPVICNFYTDKTQEQESGGSIYDLPFNVVRMQIHKIYKTGKAYNRNTPKNIDFIYRDETLLLNSPMYKGSKLRLADIISTQTHINEDELIKRMFAPRWEDIENQISKIKKDIEHKNKEKSKYSREWQPQKIEECETAITATTNRLSELQQELAELKDKLRKTKTQNIKAITDCFQQHKDAGIIKDFQRYESSRTKEYIWKWIWASSKQKTTNKGRTKEKPTE